MILIKKVLFFTLFTLSSYAAYAAERIVAVALDGTGEFTNPIDAVNSITDASNLRRYVVSVGPGIYWLQGQTIIAKPYVTLVGAGPESTIIQSAASASQGSGNLSSVVHFESFANDVTGVIRDLTIRNFDNSDGFNAGITIDRSRVLLENVNIEVRGRSFGKVGISYRGGRLETDNVNIIVSNNEVSTGVAGDGGGSIIKDSTLFVFGGGTAAGVRVNEDNLRIVNSSVQSGDFGVDGTLSTINISNSEISAGAAFIQFENRSSSIRDSVLIGSSNSAIDMNNFDGTQVIDTQVINGIIQDPPGTNCLGVFDENLNSVSC